MISQLTSNLDNAYRVDLNHDGDYRFDLESEPLDCTWCSVTQEPATPSFEPATLANGNNAGRCTTFRLKTKV